MELIDENSYFRNIVKDAVKELKEKGYTTLFFKDQVEAVKDIIKCEINIHYDGTFYNITLKKPYNQK